MISKLAIPLFLSVLSYAHAATLTAHKVTTSPVIDGQNNDKAWQAASWHPLNQLILGETPTAKDFSGRFKIMWDANKLYLLVEVTDDILFDQHPNPLESYWDDDCLEIFIDEDASGGEHQFNFNAFAYHVGLDNQSVDIGHQQKDGTADFLLLNEHINSRWKRSSTKPYNITWEVALKVYDDSFSYQINKDSIIFKGEPVTLFEGKKLGFMLAYCDNDGSKQRESFIGSTAITPINGDKNLGYKTADVFDQLILKP